MNRSSRTRVKSLGRKFPVIPEIMLPSNRVKTTSIPEELESPTSPFSFLQGKAEGVREKSPVVRKEIEIGMRPISKSKPEASLPAGPDRKGSEDYQPKLMPISFGVFPVTSTQDRVQTESRKTSIDQMAIRTSERMTRKGQPVAARVEETRVAETKHHEVAPSLRSLDESREEGLKTSHLEEAFQSDSIHAEKTAEPKQVNSRSSTTATSFHSKLKEVLVDLQKTSTTLLTLEHSLWDPKFIFLCLKSLTQSLELELSRGPLDQVVRLSNQAEANQQAARLLQLSDPHPIHWPTSVASKPMGLNLLGHNPPAARPLIQESPPKARSHGLLNTAFSGMVNEPVQKTLLLTTTQAQPILDPAPPFRTPEKVGLRHNEFGLSAVHPKVLYDYSAEKYQVNLTAPKRIRLGSLFGPPR